MRSALSERIYALARLIPHGKVASYGQLALLAGHPRAARVVGGAMRACHMPDVPCHRVVRTDGSTAPGAFGVPGLQRRLLEDEGVAFTEDGRVDMRRFQWRGPEERMDDGAIEEVGSDRYT